MRILGFDRHWPKLDQPEFTTFRFRRKDANRGRDWKIGEEVQIVVRPRASHASGKRESMGLATIISKEPTCMGMVTEEEAIVDGFPGGWEDMDRWMKKAHGWFRPSTTINKLTLRRVEAK